MTWISSQGHAHRLDYVMLPSQWQEFQVRSYVQHQVDLSLAKHDHFVAAVDVCFAVKERTHERSSRTRIDVAKCEVPQDRQQFLDFIQHEPTIPWTCGIGTHAELLTQWISQGALQCFPKQKHQPRQRYISNETWDVIQLRKLLAGMHRRTCFQLKQLKRKMFFRQWFNAFAQQRTGLSIVLHPTWIQATSKIAHQLAQQAMWTLASRRRLHPLARLQATVMLADRFVEAIHGKETKQMYRSLRPLLGQVHRKSLQAFKPVPAVRLANNQLASTPEEALERWRSHQCACPPTRSDD